MALNVDAALSFADDTSGTYPGLCDHFVGLAYGKEHSGYASAWAHWNATPAKLRHAGDKNPPVGALVYWNDSVGGGHGHTAIVTGKDKNGEAIITSTHANGGRPTTFTLSSVMPGAYAGWATPYFQGQTAKLDTSKVAQAVQEVGDDPVKYASSTDLPVDKITKKGLAESFSISWDFVKAHPDVMKVFQKAIDADWMSSDTGKRNFTNALQQTSWFQDNSKYAQQYLFLKDQGGENFNEQIRAAQEYVRQTAQKMGAKLDDTQLKFFAEQTLMNGWNVDGRSSLLPQALSGDLSWKGQDGQAHTFQTDFINYDAGGPAATMQTLKNVAWQNGVTYDDSYFRGAAKAVASGLGSIDDYVAEIRKSASSRSPWWKNQIDAGANARDLASPYIDVYTKLRGVDPSSVSLDDPNVKLAFNKTDPKTGTVAPMGLWDYEKALRQSDWYEYTQDAHDRVGKYVSTIGKMFGFL